MWHGRRVERNARGFRVLWAALAGLAFVAGCDRSPPSEPPSEPPERPSRLRQDAGIAALLGLDAGELSAEPPSDPPAPAGDLKSEVEAFTTLEACVASRAAFDPVVGDAVDALGYRTLKRDACRVLLAVKTKDAKACEDILASSLRERCVTAVAVSSGNPLACPMIDGRHDAFCTALARRDDRLCDVVEREERASCRAVIAKDDGKCGHDDRCRRWVERWKSLLPEQEEKPELGTLASVEVAERIEGGMTAPQTFSLTRAVQGATLRRDASGAVLLIGESSAKTWPPAMIVTEPRISLRVSADAAVIKQGRHTVPEDAVRFALLLPKRGTLTTEAPEGPITINVDLVGTEIGSPVRFTLEADVGPSHRKNHVVLRINTFVRDVVNVGATAP